MRYTQPQSGPAPVDTSHPLAKGLALAVNPGTSPFRDMAGRTAVRNGISVAPGPRGIGYVAAGNASLGVQFATSPMRTSDGAGTGDFTYLVIANPVASATREFFVCCQNGTNEFYFGANFSVGLAASSGVVSAQTNTTSPSGVDVPGGADGKPHVYVYTRNSASSLGSLYVDGLLGVSSSIISPVMWSSGSSDYIAGYSGAGWGISKGVFLVLGWNRALSAAEVKSISANPWQLFRSPQRVMVAAAGGPDVTIALTGQATTAATGTVGPSNAIPVVGSSATVAAGSVSVGSDVTVALAGQAMTASRGTLAPGMTKALTGQASNAQQGLLTPARAIVISGQSGAASVGTIGPGTVAALTGQASATQQGVVATSGNKTVALTGQSASVAQGALTRSTPEAVFALATIMRQSAIAVQGGTMRSTVAAQGGTIKATLALSTIMRQSQINTRATMTNAPINRTVAFI